MGRFFGFLNTPLAVLVVLVVVVGVNAFLYLGQRPTTSPAERGGSRTTAVETTERPAGDGEEAPRPATTLRSTTPTQPSATATASATDSP
jgi:flagellar basal body-associated protein FliL